MIDEATTTGLQLPNKWDPSYWPSGEGLMTVAYIFAGIAMFVAGRAAWIGLGRLWHRSAPLRIYLDVAAQAGLGFGDRWWLWCVARKQKLASPITLLLSRGTLSHHAAEFTATLPSYNAAYVAGRLRNIEARLFGQEPRQ